METVFKSSNRVTYDRLQNCNFVSSEVSVIPDVRFIIFLIFWHIRHLEQCFAIEWYAVLCCSLGSVVWNIFISKNNMFKLINFCTCGDHHHHHILLSLQGRRASTKCRHLIPFLASCFTSSQLYPSPNASLWTDLLHVCLGLPLFRCPCGFQSVTPLSMVSCPFLGVCPIQFHFHLPICTDISVSSALLQSSSFEITSGQWMFRILLRQRLMNTCSFDVVCFATFHVSEPYSSTAFTLLRKMRSLRVVVMQCLKLRRLLHFLEIFQARNFDVFWQKSQKLWTCPPWVK